MKKSIIASVVALGLVSGLAQAAEKEIEFVGSVTKVTCSIVPVVDGAITLNPSVIKLGNVQPNARGKVVNFAFKPNPTATNRDVCNAMDDNGTAVLTWSGDKFSTQGLQGISGSATDAVVEIKAVNTKTGASDIVTASGTQHEFAPSLLKKGGEGLKYKAQLVSGIQAGDFKTAAKFNFSYK
ncbi:fimbrial protein [Vagococcus sp. WN89Y]|uniref:fimbrial protein n=1 Tax=Vagococcus sp. WN89Y TaxID=3457258 RepID=UPI003FCCCD90